jgi:hypothetical protein
LKFPFDKKHLDKTFDRWSVEVAPFESKTKESWEWRSSLVVGSEVDAYDRTSWCRSTILELKEVDLFDRKIQMAHIGFRYYCSTGYKKDEKGNYEGFSSKFDENISIHSPKI